MMLVRMNPQKPLSQAYKPSDNSDLSMISTSAKRFAVVEESLHQSLSPLELQRPRRLLDFVDDW
jgi:hypothetical protein